MSCLEWVMADAKEHEKPKATEAEVTEMAHQLHVARGGAAGHETKDRVQAENFLQRPKAIDQRSLEWMPKSVWGPIKWKELHTRGLVDLPMDEEGKWFQTYVDGLPCPKCRGHFEAFLSEHPPDFTSRPNFFRWTVRAHNFVNQALGKPEFTLEQARREHQFTPEPPA